MLAQIYSSDESNQHTALSLSLSLSLYHRYKVDRSSISQFKHSLSCFLSHLLESRCFFTCTSAFSPSSSPSLSLCFFRDTAAAQWPQEIVMKPMEEIVTCPKPHSSVERKVRPQTEQALNCPRCNSINTKFCYYNNYSLSQPRYFCKTCRRYWTEGGSLRNIPVGGGSRKNKRSSAMEPSLSAKKLSDLVPHSIPQQNPNPRIMDTITTQDLNLGFSSHHQDFKSIAEMIHVPNFEGSTKLELQNNNPSSSSSTSSANSSHHLSSLELLTRLSSSSSSSRGLSPFASLTTATDLNNTVYSSSGFTFDPLSGGADHHSQFKPSLNFIGSSTGYSSFPETTNGKLLFPFEDLKQVSSSNTNDHQGDQQNEDHHHQQQPGDSTSYWNGMMGGGPW